MWPFKKRNYIAIDWVDKDTGDIIFIDKMTVKAFKKIHGISPHFCIEQGKKVYKNVVVALGDKIIPEP